jgi:hypothetical protein
LQHGRGRLCCLFSEVSNISPSESDSDDDAAITYADVDLATLVGPGQQREGVEKDLWVVSLFEDKKSIRSAVMSAESSIGLIVYEKTTSKDCCVKMTDACSVPP